MKKKLKRYRVRREMIYFTDVEALDQHDAKCVANDEPFDWENVLEDKSVSAQLIIDKKGA